MNLEEAINEIRKSALMNHEIAYNTAWTKCSSAVLKSELLIYGDFSSEVLVMQLTKNNAREHYIDALNLE